MKNLRLLTIIFLFLFTLACPVARAQWDTPVPIRWVSVLPSTCDPTKRTNVLVYKYSAPIGFYYCSGTNTWTQVNAALLGGITTLNTLSGSTQTFATGTSGADFNVSSSGSTHTFNLPNASASARGALSISDYNAFKNKLESINGLTGATQSFATGTTGSDFNIVSSGTTHTFNFPNASGSVRGLLATADFTVFSNKLGTLNGLTGSTQVFGAPGAADTAAWSSVGTTHTLNLPIQSVSGSSRVGYFPYFDASNTLAKSPFWYTSGTKRFDWNNAAADSEFVMNITHTSGSAGNFFVGDLAGTSRAYAYVLDNAAFNATQIRLQANEVVVGDTEALLNTTKLMINSSGNIFTFFSSTAGAIVDFSSNVGNFKFDRTVTAAGTVGAQTINKSHGSVNFAIGASSLVLTNSTIDVNSLVFCTVMSNDTTAKSCSVTASAGSATIRLNAAATAETKVAFHVDN
jgi:hypothetical protein